MSRPIESPIFQKYQSVITPSLSRIFIIQAGHPARPVWFLGIFSRCWQLVHFISSTLETFSSPEKDSQIRVLTGCTSSTRHTRAMKISPSKRAARRPRDQNAIHTNLRIGSGAGNHIMIGTRALLFNNTQTDSILET